MLPLHDYTGQFDPAGYELRVTSMAVADELAAAAELAHGKLDRVPVAVVRGYEYLRGEGSARDLLRDAEKDLFR
jgi:coenzyme F420-0:L-glutamate ligase/coenzyme F420-1:gamma-L-glutamate ligase